MASPVQTLCEPIDVAIANGASLSAAVNMQGRVLAGAFVPSGWTSASITFQASPDGTTWYDVVDQLGVEVTITAAAGKYNAVDNSQFLGVNFIKVRSGTSGTPVNQGGARTVTLMAGTPAKSQ